jgi:hypothetical protein
MSQLPAPGSKASASALLSLVPDQLGDVYAWQRALEAEAAQPAGGRGLRLVALGERMHVAAKTARKYFDGYLREGMGYLVDARTCPALWQTRDGQGGGLSAQDRDLAALWAGKFLRSSAEAMRVMRKCWHRQQVPEDLALRGLTVPVTATPIDSGTGYPVGWSVENLCRSLRDKKFDMAAARRGRTAAAEHRPLVYTTRAKLRVGQVRQWDDMWHDFEVADYARASRGRPLEFHGLDLASGYLFDFGFRLRVQREDGSHDSLKDADFRFLLAASYATTGYLPEGTTEVIEHKTTNVSEGIERLLHDATGGAIQFVRGGIQGASALDSQFAGRAKGNFHVKAALESLHNLIHNATSALPAQTGKDRNQTPEWMHDGGRLVEKDGRPLRSAGLLKETDALLAAVRVIPPELAEQIEFGMLTRAQAMSVLQRIYAEIHGETDHKLEGWDMNWVPDGRGGMRRMSRGEVYRRGRGALRPLDMETIALLLSADGFLEQHGEERIVRKRMITLEDCELSGDKLRFDADAAGVPDGAKFMTVLNPFAPDALWIFDANGSFVASLPRKWKVDAGDLDAIHRAAGQAHSLEVKMLEEPRRRDASEAKLRIARQSHNTALLGGNTPADKARRRAMAGLDSGALLNAGTADEAEEKVIHDGSVSDAGNGSADTVQEDFHAADSGEWPGAAENESAPETEAAPTQTFDASALL